MAPAQLSTWEGLCTHCTTFLSLSLSAAVPSGETVTSSGKVHGLVQWVSMLFRSINPPWLFHDWDQQTIDQTIERGPLKRARMYQDTNKSYVEMLGTSQDKVKWVRRKYCLDAWTEEPYLRLRLGVRYPIALINHERARSRECCNQEQGRGERMD